MLLLQSLSDVKDIATTDNIAVQGLMLGIIIVLGIVIAYLFKQNQLLQEKFIQEMRSYNEALIKLNNSYNDFVSNMKTFYHEK